MKLVVCEDMRSLAFLR